MQEAHLGVEQVTADRGEVPSPLRPAIHRRLRPGIWPKLNFDQLVSSVSPVDEDDAADASAWPIDFDGDGYATNGPGDERDCGDSAGWVFPGNTDWEFPVDGLDRNCDGGGHEKLTHE